MKTTKQFIEQYRLDQENFEFNREDFLSGLNEYFLELLTLNALGIKESPNKWTEIQEKKFGFDKFKQTVKQTEEKFWSISKKKVGEPLSQKLWSAFYAIYIIPVRGHIYPKIDQEIKSRREQYLKEKKS